jgi:hypothetical protein
MDEKDITIFDCMTIACNSHNSFTLHEIEELVGQFVNPRDGVWGVLVTKWTKLHVFKTLTNFNLVQFDEAVQTTSAHA